MHTSHPDFAEPFGSRAPSAGWVSWIRRAQCAPRNWLGQQFAQIVRKAVEARCAFPIDVEVGAVRMRCRLRDNHSERKFVFMPWRFDATERRLLAEAIGRDGVFVDIGANVGIYTLDLATQLGDRGRIVCFEPHPYTSGRLRFNLDATRGGRTAWPRVEVVQAAVGDVNAPLRLSLDPCNLGGSSLRPREGAEHVEVPGVRLVDELLRRGIGRMHALKIDVEGAEDRALTPFLNEASDGLLPDLMVLEDSRRIWNPEFVPLIGRRGYRLRCRTKMNLVFDRPAGS